MDVMLDLMVLQSLKINTAVVILPLLHMDHMMLHRFVSCEIIGITISKKGAGGKSSFRCIINILRTLLQN